MKHFFKLGKDATAPPLLLLHGTGGDEYSLLEIANLLSPDSTVLSLRGDSSEAGANRFFRRFAEGEFDIENLESQTDKLLETVQDLSVQYKIPFENWVVVGYSNGANIAAHAMLERENSFNYGLLFHAMSLGKHEATFDLAHKQIWLSAGTNDPIVPKSETDALLHAFSHRGGIIETLWTNHGHQLTYEEVMSAAIWLKQMSKKNEGFA